jgi:DNA-binding LacI/PurR family transcriptional regulator
MNPIQQIPKHELVIKRIKDGLGEGKWSGNLPGVQRLSVELDVSPHTVRRALRQLEAEGFLGGRGLGRSRGITAASESHYLKRPLRIAILRHDVHLSDSPQTSLVLTDIIHSLEAVGMTVFYCKKSLIELKNDVPRLARQLLSAKADAWIVEAGSLPLLEWCSTQSTPCMALYGRTGDLPIARTGPDVIQACREAVRQLLALGHSRIVTIVREARRMPMPGANERAMLDEMTNHGVLTSSYNIPDWDETPKGLSRLLESLFKRTPPTALIIDEIPRLFAVLAFLARRGIRVPEHVSIISNDCDAVLDWCHPGIAHMQFDNAFIVRRVVRWVNAVRKGKQDRKVINVPATFISGGSIAPVFKGENFHE